MVGDRTIQRATAGSLGMILALLALLMLVVAPPGFMIADGGQGPTLVVCTGHGPLLSASDPGHPHKAPKSTSDAPCPFAGHIGPTLPIILGAPATFPVRFDLASSRPMIDQFPGRGLVAPPPPSQGPPRLS